MSQLLSDLDNAEFAQALAEARTALARLESEVECEEGIEPWLMSAARLRWQAAWVRMLETEWQRRTGAA